MLPKARACPWASKLPRLSLLVLNAPILHTIPLPSSISSFTALYRKFQLYLVSVPILEKMGEFLESWLKMGQLCL